MWLWIMGYSQVVRQRTLTPSFRWFESTYPNQNVNCIYIFILLFLFFYIFRSLGIDFFCGIMYNILGFYIIAAMAQQAEHVLGKDEVTSSNLVSSSRIIPHFTPFASDCRRCIFMPIQVLGHYQGTKNNQNNKKILRFTKY